MLFVASDAWYVPCFVQRKTGLESEVFEPPDVTDCFVVWLGLVHWFGSLVWLILSTF